MINIYKGIDFVAALNYSIEEFKPEWFDGWEKGMEIYPVKFQNPILEKGKLREMTREELVAKGIPVQLDIGEKIVNKKILKVEKPDNKSYWNWDGQKWVFDNNKEKEDAFKSIEDAKVKALSYGFDYKIEDKEHRQRCRDKDIAWLSTSMVYLMAQNMVGNTSAKVSWYFEDDYEWNATLKEISTLATHGKTFVESVYKTENFFKTSAELKVIKYEDFEEKRKSFHKKMVENYMK